MLLVDVKESDNGVWLLSRWKLTYPTGWEGILEAIASVYDYYEKPEILKIGIASKDVLEINNKENIFDIEESNALTIRGFSTIIKVPISITIYNQSRIVDVDVIKTAEGEFSKADYRSFNISMSQYLDSIEIMEHINLIKKNSKTN